MYVEHHRYNIQLKGQKVNRGEGEEEEAVGEEDHIGTMTGIRHVAVGEVVQEEDVHDVVYYHVLFITLTIIT